MVAKFSHSFKVGSDYRSSNRTRYFVAIGPANQTTPRKSKTTPTSIMDTYEGMSFVVGETFASYARKPLKRKENLVLTHISRYIMKINHVIFSLLCRSPVFFSKPVKFVLCQYQKFCKMMSLCQEICSLGSEVGMSQYEERYSVLVCIRDNWKPGKCVERTERTMCSHGILCLL